MKWKKIILACLSLSVGLFASAQHKDPRLEKLKNDPITKEQAAKADVYVMKKSIYTDSMAATTKYATAAKKKQPCQHRKSQ